MEITELIERAEIDVVRKITLTEAAELNILPLYKDNNYVYVIAKDKGNSKDIYLNFLFKEEIRYILVKDEVFHSLINIFLDFDYELLEEKIIEEAIDSNVSDIHFEPEEHILKIRVRINGFLILKKILRIEEYNKILCRIKNNCKMDITTKRVPQDGKMSYKYKNENYNIRVSSVPLLFGEKLVLRIIYDEKLVSSLSDLNFNENQMTKIKKLVSLKNGLLIINGPTGSGKSTTMYNILNSIKRKAINITTLEDPIEVNIKGINQINLNPKIGIDFAEGIRSILRQDPDVIMVGEIRDDETAKMSVRASITGHKVYSTIHTKNPREVYLRLEEMGVKDYLIRDALCGIISQRLIKTLCSNCKCLVKEIHKDDKVIKLYKKKGCISCNNTGYAGRKLVASINLIDKNTRRSLKNIKTNYELLNNDEMFQSLESLLIKGEIDIYDFFEFLEGEEIGEEELQKYREYLR